MQGVGYRDPGRGLPQREMYFREGFIEQNIARELSRFRDPIPRPNPVPDFYNDGSSFNRDVFPDRTNDRGRDMGFERGRHPDPEYQHRERSRRTRWEREPEFSDNANTRDDFRDYGSYRERSYKERDREYDGERRDYENRDREGHRDRDWDRSRSHRGSDHSKEQPRHRRERTTRWDDGYDEKRERKRSSSRERDRERRSDHDTKEAEFKNDNEPTSVIMLRGLRDEIKEDDILQELYAAEVAFKDVRIVRNKIGYTRGFGFVECEDEAAAKLWIDQTRGRLIIKGFSIGIDYSRPKNVQDKDWNCSQCGTQNFSSRRRTTCFSCGTLKEVSTGEDKDNTSAPPCKVLILKGLDVLTNEETVRTVLSSITTLPIYDIRLIRDKLTNTSRGFCFVELSSIEDATTLLEKLTIMNPPFEIDGRMINTLYAKNSEPAPATKPSNVATAAIEQAQWSAQPNTSAAMAIAQAQAASLPPYPPALGLHQVQLGFNNTGLDEASIINTSIAPQPANFVYDPTSGYYYDSTTGLYYDAATQYYYNSSTSQYLYWDATTCQYTPVAADGSSTTTTPAATSTPTPTTAVAATTTVTSSAASAPSTEPLDSLAAKEKQKKAKSLQAKKIAKDMERWARNVNAAKSHQQPPTADETKKQVEEPEFKKPTLPPPKLLTVLTKATSSADEPQAPVKVMSSPLSGMIISSRATKDEPPADTGSKWSSIVPEYGEDDDSDPEPDPEPSDKFADLKLMACLLCKRQFPNKEALNRHIEFSDLHKQNVEVHKKMSLSDKQREDLERREREAKYRDRAKERREKYNQPDISSTFSQPPPPRKRKGFQPTSKFEQPTKEGIGSENIGNKMLRAMGWSQGSGLGKDGQGIVDPIKAQMRTQYAGLGASGSSYGSVTGGESQREKRQKLAMSRFNEL